MSQAPSAVGPPARRQRTLLGFLKMSSLTHHSLEQIEVAVGTLATEQTRDQSGPGVHQEKVQESKSDKHSSRPLPMPMELELERSALGTMIRPAETAS